MDAVRRQARAHRGRSGRRQRSQTREETAFDVLKTKDSWPTRPDQRHRHELLAVEKLLRQQSHGAACPADQPHRLSDADTRDVAASTTTAGTATASSTTNPTRTTTHTPISPTRCNIVVSASRRTTPAGRCCASAGTSARTVLMAQLPALPLDVISQSHLRPRCRASRAPYPMKPRLPCRASEVSYLRKITLMEVVKLPVADEAREDIIHYLENLLASVRGGDVETIFIIAIANGGGGITPVKRAKKSTASKPSGTSKHSNST